MCSASLVGMISQWNVSEVRATMERSEEIRMRSENDLERERKLEHFDFEEGKVKSYLTFLWTLTIIFVRFWRVDLGKIGHQLSPVHLPPFVFCFFFFCFLLLASNFPAFFLKYCCNNYYPEKDKDKNYLDYLFFHWENVFFTCPEMSKSNNS